MKGMQEKMQDMKKYSALFLLAFGFLGACTAAELPSILPVNVAKNDIQSKSYLVTFYRNSADMSLMSRSGLTFPNFLRKLAQDPPGYVRLQPVSTTLRERELLNKLEVSGLHRLSEISIAPATSVSVASSAALNVEVTYYYYDLANCGASLSYRKLDYLAMKSPGFGCAVNRNRMISLARPSDWHFGRRLAPPLAQSDARAVSRFESLAPVPFPPSNK